MEVEVCAEYVGWLGDTVTTVDLVIAEDEDAGVCAGPALIGGRVGGGVLSLISPSSRSDCAGDAFCALIFPLTSWLFFKRLLSAASRSALTSCPGPLLEVARCGEEGRE
jgi:hypothetical protein